MRQEERFSLILERLSEKGSVGVNDLSGDLGVSLASIRRDLQILENQRLLTRTHGGAVALNMVYELPLRYRGGRHKEEKRRIALEAAERVGAGINSVGLTGGTTTTEVARALMERSGLTIVTNALNIASELALRPNLKLLVTGGWARSESYELVGPLAEASLQGLNLDLAIVGVDGISAQGGITTHDVVEARTNRAMLDRAGRVVVVADGSKVGRMAFACIAPVTVLGELITDASANPGELERLREAGMVITII
ncbi:MAG: DeoR/GlpR transcriptional regulator [Acidobacteria bacterium]|nr:DeoR/GlpR transcriptional regulator [Acidobacteriota bacterium]